MKKGLKYSFLTLAWIVAIVVLLLLLASLLIQTQPVKNRLARISENQAEKMHNGELTIGKIDGNFFTGLILENVLLKYEKDTLAYINKFTVNYNLWSLVNGNVSISSAEIENPYFYLKQYEDSTWNVQKIAKVEPGEKDTTKSPSKFDINLSDVSIVEGTVKTNTPDTIVPERIENWNTQFSLFLGGNEQNATIDNFSLSTVNPNFSLNELTFEVKRDSNYIQLTDFFIKTAQNQLEGSAEYNPEPNREGSANFETSELQLNEFEYFIPSLKLPAKPVVTIDAEMEGDSVFVNLDLKENNQHIIIKASSPNLAEFLFNPQKPELIYIVDGTLENIELGHWIGNPELNYYINGQLSASGRGIDPANASIKVNADFNETVIEDKRLTELLVDLQLNQGNLDGIVQGNGEFGEFRISPEIQNLFETPVYQAKIQTNNLDLARLTGNESLSSNLNLSASVKGESFDPDKLSAKAEIIISESRFREIQMDTLVADAGFQNQNLQIDSLWLKTENLTMNASGNYHLDGVSDLRLSANFESIEEFSPYIPLDSFKTSGNIDAHLQGTTDSMGIAANLKLNSTQYNEITLQSFTLNANANINPQDTTFDAHGIANELVSGENNLDSIAFDVEGNLDSMFLAANIANSDINTQIKTGFTPGDILTFTISEWQINYKNQEWMLQQTPATVKIDSLTYSVDNFKLASGQGDSSMYILLQGEITRNGQEDFLIEIANIDLKKIDQMFELETNVSGTFDMKMNIEGTAQSPVIEGSYQLSEAAFNEYNFTEFKGGLNYKDEHLNFSTLVIPEDSGKVDITASVPLVINPDTMGFHFNPKDSIDGRLIVEKFPLAILRAFNITGDIAGHLEGEVSLGGTAESPQTEGNLRLQNASVEIDKYGIDYREIRLNLNFDNNKLVLDTLNIRSDDGSLTGTGEVNFESDFYKGNVSQSQINLDFDQFNLVDHDQFNMQVTGNANLGGEKGNVVYGGDLKIPQAEIYLPAILGMVGQMNVPEIPKPILVREVERMDVSADSIEIQTFSPPKPASNMQFTYLNDLQGQLRIRIPKNTWIKNEDMRVEISGELELRKNKEYFELFGSVDVVRGQYDLLGKTFNITEGSVSFQGGEEIQPRLNINATYAFRNAQKAQQNLSVQITGTPESPEVNFLLDGSSISEGDALSYILFGKGMNELTLSEQENVAGSGNIAERAAASVLSAQLSSFLGSKLNVDYIEVKSQGSFDNASVVVGKYITNDLFVSYEQRFGEVDEKDVAKYEVKLEYELFRFLFFELNNSSNDSGFDVIVKFDVK
jgi:translocation and assembly module TamB